MVDVLIRRLDPAAPMPVYAHPGDAGADLVDHRRRDAGARRAGHRPDRCEHRAAGRLRRPGASALRAGGARRAVRSSTPPAPSTPAIAARSRCCSSTSTPSRGRLSRGDRIAQVVFQRVEQARFVEVERLPGSDRGEGGYGSTGGFVSAADRTRRTSRDFPSQGRRPSSPTRPSRGTRRPRDSTSSSRPAARSLGPRRDRRRRGGRGLHRPRRAGGQARLRGSSCGCRSTSRRRRSRGHAGRCRVRAGAAGLRGPALRAASGTRSAPTSPPRPPSAAGRRPSSTASSAPSCKVVVPVQTPDGQQAHADQPDRRRRRAAVAAARHVPGQERVEPDPEGAVETAFRDVDRRPRRRADGPARHDRDDRCRPGPGRTHAEDSAAD